MRFLFACLLILSASPAMAQNPPIPPDALAAARRPVVMTLPGVDKVQVTKDLRYTDALGDHLRMDGWRPPGLNASDRRPAVLYVHPWELDPDQPRPRMSWVHRFRHYTGLRTAERKLRALLAEFRFAAVEAVFDQVRPARRAAARAS